MGHGHDRVHCAPAKLFYRTLWLYENMVKNPSFAPTKSPSSFAKSQPSLTCLVAYHNLPRNQNQVAHVHTSVELYQLLTLIIHNLSLSDIPTLHPRSQQIHIWRRKRTITSQDPCVDTSVIAKWSSSYMKAPSFCKYLTKGSPDISSGADNLFNYPDYMP